MCKQKRPNPVGSGAGQKRKDNYRKFQFQQYGNTGNFKNPPAGYGRKKFDREILESFKTKFGNRILGRIAGEWLEQLPGNEKGGLE